MAKGSKRQRLKEALSPVRNALSPKPASPPQPGAIPDRDEDGDSSSSDDADILDDLMAELDSRDAGAAGKAEAATVIREMQKNEAVNEDPLGESTKKESSKSRHQKRQERRAAELADKYAPVDVDAEARLAAEAKEEERSINETCAKLGRELHDIQPDGHCLFSAIADQLALLSLIPESAASYTTTRKTASELMRAHPDDFIPFLPSIAGEDGSGATDDGLMNPAQFGTYCERIAGTAQWGGEPEIQALARAYAVPIHVVQGGEPRIVVHEPGGPARSVAPVLISYHRRMYGLGEHYNSLRPKRRASRPSDGMGAMVS